jgi:cytochrome b561
MAMDGAGCLTPGEPRIEDRGDVNTGASSSYTRTAIALHWLAAALILANFVLGPWMVDLPITPQKLRLYAWHKWIGITVFLMVVARLAWRHWHSPPPPVAMPDWQRRAAGVTHALLYVLMVLIPLSGWIYSSAAGVQVVYLGLVPLPDLVAKDKVLAAILKAVHATLNFSLLALVFLHAGAAFKHHLVDRDGVLARMVPFLARK